MKAKKSMTIKGRDESSLSVENGTRLFASCLVHGTQLFQIIDLDKIVCAELQATEVRSKEACLILDNIRVNGVYNLEELRSFMINLM